MGSILFEDIFQIKDIDKDGKKFDKVSRIYGTSESYEMELILDVDCDVYPLEVGNKFTFALASTLNLDGSPDEGVFEQSGKPSLADKYEYVMYGKVFKIAEEKGSGLVKVAIYVSFGGLLMMLNGDPRNLQGIDSETRLYLLMRKTI